MPDTVYVTLPANNSTAMASTKNRIRSILIGFKDEWVRESRSKKFWLSWLGVTLGVIIMSAGYVLFTNPYKIIPGGVYGLGRVFHHLVPSIQTGTFGFMMDIPLMIIGLLVFGSGFGAKTVYAALITPVFMNSMTNLLGENPADGVSFISVYMNLSDNILVAAIFGGALIGAGVGTIVKFGATSGGTDIISMLLTKYARMKFSAAMFLVESAVVITGMIILQDWKLPLYSLIAIFVSAQAVDFVVDGAQNKLLFIITEKTEEMKRYILHELEWGSTFIKSRGMYSGQDRDMIFLVVNKRQITTVEDKIKEIDPASFLVIVNAHETFGNRFKPFR